MQTLTIKKFSSNPEKILNSLKKSHSSLMVTKNEKPAFVVQEIIEEYEKFRKALMFLKIMVQGENDIKEGKYISQKEALENLRKEIFQQ